jgi:hypothetical protein
MGFALVCPHCKGKFKWSPLDGMPETCELCGEFVGQTRGDDEIHMPAFLSAGTRANDKLYRDVEVASEHRSYAAAEKLGVDVKDVAADLKITDLRSTMHEGAVAAAPVNNEVTQVMAQADPRQSPWGFSQSGLGYSGNVQAGPLPNAGARTQHVLNAHHAEISRGSAVSDRPALETVMPGYRRRA